MSTPVLTIAPDYGWSDSMQPRVRAMRFGDGYQQLIPDGLNTLLAEVSVPFTNRTDAQRDQLLALFTSLGGAKPFLFTLPGKVQKAYICTRWTESRAGHNANNVQATFQEWGGPV
ncbi:phage tail protein [Chitinimonas taiwanensis]|uniref:phage tail protein n=1 Tax=Chitinimonas taiwanensis TaxID=240412 RepID=UPI0035ADD5F7